MTARGRPSACLTRRLRSAPVGERTKRCWLNGMAARSPTRVLSVTGFVCAGAGFASIRLACFHTTMFLAFGQQNIAILTWRQLQSVAHFFSRGFLMRIGVVFGLVMLSASLTGA